MGVPAMKKDLKSLSIVDGKEEADTLRLWDRYKEQALMWRALFLIQFPVTFIALIALLIVYLSADTIVEVPERPQPGQYSLKQLPDSEFINVATQVVNLISSYQQFTARPQFSLARKYLWEPALSQFETEMMNDELRIVEQTSRSQMFFIDKSQIKVERHPELDKLIVRIPGIRQKLIGGSALPPDEMVYYLKLTTIPRNNFNEYGIVVIDIRAVFKPLQMIREEDRRDEREKAREEAKQKKGKR